MNKENPYTMDFGKEPNQYISRTIQFDEIFKSLNTEKINRQAYVISGVRGAGKTVFWPHLKTNLKSLRIGL